jgi:hypothetical protein
MRALFSILVVGVAVLAAGTVAAVPDIHTPGEFVPGGTPPVASAPCQDRLYCNSFTEHPDVSWYADGEWRPDGTIGWISTGSTIQTTDELCTMGPVCQPAFDPNNGGSVTRAFAWGIGAGDSWVGSWHFPPNNAKLAHVDAACNVIAEFEILDTDTGLPLQYGGLAMDTANGHLWANLRNNPVGTPSRFIELDINGAGPVILQGPMIAPWPEGPSIGVGGFDYNERDCTLIAMRQDGGNVPNAGTARIAVFKDNLPAGIGGVSFLAECQINLTAHCTGTADQANPNHPWGLAVVGGDFLYAIFSEINLDPGCGVPAAPAVSDVSFVSLPGYESICEKTTAVEPTTWGRVKNSYK